MIEQLIGYLIFGFVAAAFTAEVLNEQGCVRSAVRKIKNKRKQRKEKFDEDTMTSVTELINNHDDYRVIIDEYSIRFFVGDEEVMKFVTKDNKGGMNSR